MKKNLMPLLGVAFVAAIIATGIFYGLLITRLRPAQAAPTGQVAVAARQLDRGAVLKPDDLKTIDWSGKRPQGALASPETVYGQTLLEPLAMNEPLTQTHLAPRGVAGGASLAIPAGMRAVCIHPSESGGVIAMLRSGSRIDVQVLDPRGGPGASMQLRRLLENVEVLSTGGIEGAGSKSTVTLLVKPDDADRLSLADAAMRVRIVLRNPTDKDTRTTAPVSPVGALRPPAAASPLTAKLGQLP